MNNAIYAITTGMLNRSRALDVTANNLANSAVSGFKRDGLITSTFDEQLMLRIDGDTQQIGSANHGTMSDTVYADLTQGPLEATNRNLDVAILGDGFFAVQDDQGVNGLSRNGSFQIRSDGYLVNAAGAYVLGQNGRIRVGQGEIAISETGAITVGGANAGTLLVVVPQNPGTLQKQDNGTFARPAGNGTFTGTILQGHLERANVDMVEEMSDMMEASRSFQSCGQVLKILDEISKKTVNDIGRA